MIDLLIPYNNINLTFSDIITIAKKWSFICYKKYIKKDCLTDFNKYYPIVLFLSSSYPDIWNTAYKAAVNSYSKVRRLKNKIEYVCNNFESPCFLSLTFNESCLSSTSAATRRKYITNYLNSLGCWYCANIDFGKKNEREHYHAIITRKLTVDEIRAWFNLCGSIKSIIIRCNNTSSIKLSKYINKLSYHAFKDTTCHKLIYCRKIKLPV